MQLEVPPSNRSLLDADDIRNSLRALMWRNVGITRQETPLSEAVEIIRFWQRYVMDKVFTNPFGWECQNMLTVCLLMAHSAEQRKESRGVHYRQDFPNRDDANFARHIELKRE
jgi:L-aspartate oxidase